ncbi:multiple organellar RNA editing factor 8, chloroplastic/mitochondrial isoform X2 [Daucus carota subsp. sativus]|uniref:multiple organellar RNA editing factor 8, chloroplastic/mitochondrial isoform X2 n=1 Tax=Daucus carota subsp. sativus TaxID=79200 RepID=UPI003083C113
MATRIFSTSLLTKSYFTSLLSRSFSSLSVKSPPSSIPSLSSLSRLRPITSVAFNLARHSPAVRCFATRQTTSSLNDSSPNFSNRPPKETILLDGCDFEHWLIVMEKPEGEPTRDEIIDSYIKTLATVVGSEQEARMKIYSVSTRHYYAFGALISEELSYKMKELEKVRWVLPDSYLDVKNKDYGGEPFINGEAVPYDPKYHEEWVRNNARANERNRRNDRPRNFDRSRNFERKRENMQQNRQGPGPNNMGGPPGVGGPQNMGPGMGGPQNMGGGPPGMGGPQNMGGPPGMGGPQNMGGGPPGRGGPQNMGGPPGMGGPQNMGGGPPGMGGPQNMGGPGGPQYMGGGPSNMGGGPSNMGRMPQDSMGGMPQNNLGGMQQNNLGGGAPPPNYMGGGVPPNSGTGNFQPRNMPNNEGYNQQSGPGPNSQYQNYPGNMPAAGNSYQNQDMLERDMPGRNYQ